MRKKPRKQKILNPQKLKINKKEQDKNKNLKSTEFFKK